MVLTLDSPNMHKSKPGVATVPVVINSAFQFIVATTSEAVERVGG